MTIKSVLELLTIRTDLNTNKVHILKQLTLNHEQLIEACIKEGAHDCLSVNYSRIRKYFSAHKAKE